jgi:hypothetical protein
MRDVCATHRAKIVYPIPGYYTSLQVAERLHTDHDGAWADKMVRQWHNGDYQAAVNA